MPSVQTDNGTQLNSRAMHSRFTHTRTSSISPRITTRNRKREARCESESEIVYTVRTQNKMYKHKTYAYTHRTKSIYTKYIYCTRCARCVINGPCQPIGHGHVTDTARIIMPTHMWWSCGSSHARSSRKSIQIYTHTHIRK